jgi:hypothetical protein
MLVITQYESVDMGEENNTLKVLLPDAVIDPTPQEFSRYAITGVLVPGFAGTTIVPHAVAAPPEWTLLDTDVYVAPRTLEKVVPTAEAPLRM